jgi:hypothetical protein
MTRYILASLGVGLLFVLLDGLLNVNPLAQRAHKAYSAIARKSMNLALAVAIDLAYGFIIAALYLILYRALPGAPGLVRTVSFAVILWILRVVMAALGHWVMFEVPASTHLYDIAAGLAEMLVISAFCALTLRPVA